MSLAVLDVDILGAVKECGPDCPDFVAKWCDWCAQFQGKNLALVPVDGSYYTSLDRKSRYMVRKVESRGYVFHPFIYNDHLQDIYEINTSKEKRQDKPMSDNYLAYPAPISKEFVGCSIHQYLRLGCFKEGKMYAYCALAVLNELAILNTIIGHADALTDGVMNGLINYLVKTCASIPTVKYLNYLTIESSGESLQMFKHSVGFESYKVEFK